jgi:hypothetical protein
MTASLINVFMYRLCAIFFALPQFEVFSSQVRANIGINAMKTSRGLPESSFISPLLLPRGTLPTGLTIYIPLATSCVVLVKPL